MSPPRIYLYSEPAAPALNISELGQYVRAKLPRLELQVRGSFLDFHLPSSPGEREEAIGRLALGFAEAKIRNPARQEPDFTPLPGEVAYERKRLTSPSPTFGLLYDGFRVMTLLQELLPPDERRLDQIHIAFTNQLLGTWEESDRRYHARVAVFGFPNLISTTGLVEAPAKPREFYLLKQQYAALGMPDAAVVGLEGQLGGQFIGHGDERITEAMKGYVIQSVFYALAGDPFCPDKNCRLYNAHWQQEVIQAQLTSPYEFCPLHRQQLEEMQKA
jgi:hypothetical protein